MAKLKDARREEFAQQYVFGEYRNNATQSAILAGYSKKTAKQQATRLLSNVYVKQRIAELVAERREKTEITADRIKQEYACIAFSDITDYLDVGQEGVTIEQFRQLPKHITAAISEVSQHSTKYGLVIKFKLYSKVDALRDLGKHIGMFTDRIEHTGDLTHRVVEIPTKKADGADVDK